jgi:hypothetical protein
MNDPTEAAAAELRALLPQAAHDPAVMRALRLAYLQGYIAALEADRAERRAALHEVFDSAANHVGAVAQAAAEGTGNA